MKLWNFKTKNFALVCFTEKDTFNPPATLPARPAITPFLHQYVVAALWSSTDDSEKPMDDNYTIDDLAPETLFEMSQDCLSFQEQAAGMYPPERETRAAHDFWLTRNGHGAGFWDGDWQEPEASQLDNLAKSFGGYDLYIGDDGRIYGGRG